MRSRGTGFGHRIVVVPERAIVMMVLGDHRGIVEVGYGRRLLGMMRGRRTMQACRTQRCLEWHR